jgi:hypothetical protein
VSPGQRSVLVELCRPVLESRNRDAQPPTNDQIAASLIISVDTVRSHLKALYGAFEVPASAAPGQKRAILVAKAIEGGYVNDRDLR